MRSGYPYLAFTVPLLLIAAPAAAEPKSVEAKTVEPKTIDDCEAIQAADAYNQCLALFGPVAHEHAMRGEPDGPTAGQDGPGLVAHAGRRGSQSVVRTHGPVTATRAAGRRHTTVQAVVRTDARGRKHMQFSVVPGRSRIQ